MKRIFFSFLVLATTFVVHAQKHEFANFNRYAEANKTLGNPQPDEMRVVLMGNSITNNWANRRTDFFKTNNLVGRGIGGQTSYQFLLRFREDVINLKPSIVVINFGTNDIAENTGPYDEDITFGNMLSMVELAQFHHAKVILTSTLPAAGFRWRKNITDAMDKIRSLNARTKAYADEHQIPYVDYFTALLAKDGSGMDPEYGEDTPAVHPNDKGYEIMEALLLPVIQRLRVNEPNVKYGTFNLRYKDGDKGTVYDWSNRRDSLCRFIYDQHFDIIGTQEGLNSQLEDMMKRLPDYKYVGVGRENGKQKGEYAAIFYLHHRWMLVKSGNFWLSETPDVAGSIGWDAMCSRVCTWALLRDKHTGLEVVAFNTHFDHIGKQARRESTGLLLRMVREIAGDVPFVITGDFNANERGGVYKHLMSGKDLKIIDTHKTQAPHGGVDYTYNGYGTSKDKIDYIFTSPSISTISTYIPADKRPFFMSDHNPAIAELYVPNVASEQ